MCSSDLFASLAGEVLENVVALMKLLKGHLPSTDFVTPDFETTS